MSKESIKEKLIITLEEINNGRKINKESDSVINKKTSENSSRLKRVSINI